MSTQLSLRCCVAFGIGDDGWPGRLTSSVFGDTLTCGACDNGPGTDDGDEFFGSSTLNSSLDFSSRPGRR